MKVKEFIRSEGQTTTSVHARIPAAGGHVGRQGKHAATGKSTLILQFPSPPPRTHARTCARARTTENDSSTQATSVYRSKKQRKKLVDKMRKNAAGSKPDDVRVAVQVDGAKIVNPMLDLGDNFG